MAYDRTLKHFVSAFELAPLWQSGTVYALNQLVVYNQRLYSCALAHTAGGSFETDHAAGDWLEVSSGTTVWVSGTYYELNQFVEESNQLYQCIVAHTAGTFATDLTAGKWVGLLPGQTVPISLGGTGQTTQTAAFDALAPTTTAGDIIVHNGTDNVRQGIGSDGQVLVVDSAQTNKLKWATIQQGSKNYIPNSTFENGVTPPSSWSTFNVTIDATTKVPSGAITSPDATYTLATSSSSALAGAYSMTATTGGTVTITTTGRGFISDAFTIDREDQAKPMQFSFYYEAVSGAMDFSGTSSNTFAVYVYDVTNSTWIQPAGVYNMTQGSGVGLASGTFQTSATGTQYRLAVIMISSVTGALSIKLDDFRLGPQTVVYGSPVTDWVSYTPTLGGITLGTGTQRFFWRRVGDSIEIKGNILFTASTSVTGKFTFTLPAGFSIDSTKNPYPGAVNGFSRLGVASVYDTTQRSILSIVQDSTSSNTFYLNGKDGTTSITQVDNTSFTWGSADEIEIIELTVPIQGWSSSVQMSSDTDTRVVVADAYVSINTTAAPNNSAFDLIVNAVNTDTHGTVNTITGTITIPVSGYYNLNGRVGIFGANVLASRYNAQIRDSANTILVDGTAITPTAGTVNGLVASGTSIFLTAGTVIKLSLFGAGNNSSSQVGISGAGPATTRLSASRVSGPATIAASETVAARYNTSTSTIGTTTTTAVMTNKIFDTHNAYSTISGDYIVPVSGKYLVAGSLAYSSVTASSIGGRVALRFVKNGSTFAEPGYFAYQQTTTSIGPTVFGSAAINCVAGDVLRIAGVVNASVGGGSVALTGITTTYFDVVRIGN